MSTATIPVVEKETIGNLKFPDAEVLASKEDQVQRRLDLERATTLGNLEHNKVKIHFVDSEGLKQVETTIWATTDFRILLKGGVQIPIHRIKSVIII